MIVSALLLGSAAPACDPAEPASQTARSARSARSASAPPDPGAQTREPAAPPRRGRLIAGERVQSWPVWPPASAIDHALRGRAPAAVLVEVARSPVPVLLPGDPAWLARGALYVPAGPRAHGYTFASAVGERHLSVHASRIATLLPHIEPVRGAPVRGGHGFFSVNEGVRTASWIEHGVAYGLDLECFDPGAADCDDATLRDLVAGLVYVGGAAAVGGAR